MPLRLPKPLAIIVDVEGTTTSMKFWGEAMVPYIKTHCGKCLREKWGSTDIMECVDRLRRKTEKERMFKPNVPVIAGANSNREEIINSVVSHVMYQMNNKVHNTALKNLQILIWLYGCEKRDLKGHVFDDVSTAMEKWKKDNIKIYTYSSGLSLVQKLMFSCSVRGNLTVLIDDFLDTEVVGPKTNVESYRKIAERINVGVSRILFLSDNPQEIKAAKRASCMAVLVSRPGNKPISDSERQECGNVIKNFLDIKFSEYN